MEQEPFDLFIFSVDVKVVTWLKDSHGLFDYESKKISLKRLRVDSHSKVYREGIVNES